MKFIQDPDIGPRSSVESIVNLQEVLLFLIDKVCIKFSAEELPFILDELRRDKKNQAYETGTSNVVMAFRRQFQLGEGELVDEVTAKELNKLLRELGGVDQPDEDLMRVFGEVRDEFGSPLINVTIQAFDRDMIFTRFYGHTAKRVISNPEVTNENQERRRRPIKTSKIYSPV